MARVKNTTLSADLREVNTLGRVLQTVTTWQSRWYPARTNKTGDEYTGTAGI